MRGEVGPRSESIAQRRSAIATPSQRRHRLRDEAAGPCVEDVMKGVLEVLEASSQRA
jgi:hypothetical protein